MKIGQSAEKTKQLAYIVGVYLGDGWMGYVKSRNGWDFRLNTIDLDFALETQKALYGLTGNKGHICTYPVSKSSKLNNSLTVGVKELFWLKDLGKERLPKFIKDLSKDNKLELLAGLFDSEGWVQIDKRHPNTITIGIKATSGWVYDLYKMCTQAGIKVSKIGKEILPSGKTAVRFHFNTVSFVENGCYFKIKRKQDKINQWVASNSQRLHAEHESDDIVRTA